MAWVSLEWEQECILGNLMGGITELREAMTQQVLFVQGGGQRVHDEWDNKIVESLERELGREYAVRYPRMPREADPKYADWKAALKREFDGLDDGAILIGHSIGGTVLIRTLADDPPKWTIAGIFLIAAPFVGDGGWPSDEIEPLSDLGAKLPEHTPIYLFHGSKDQTAPFGHVELYAKSIPQAVVRRLAGRDHQLDNNMSEVAADVRRVRTARRLPVRPA
jgi:predicted alpha/beta hydrolase family esterase